MISHMRALLLLISITLPVGCGDVAQEEGLTYQPEQSAEGPCRPNPCHGAAPICLETIHGYECRLPRWGRQIEPVSSAEFSLSPHIIYGSNQPLILDGAPQGDYASGGYELQVPEEATYRIRITGTFGVQGSVPAEVGFAVHDTSYDVWHVTRGGEAIQDTWSTTAETADVQVSAELWVTGGPAVMLTSTGAGVVAQDVSLVVEQF